MHVGLPDPFWLVVCSIVVGFFLVPLALFVYDRRRERRHPHFPPPRHRDERSF